MNTSTPFLRPFAALRPRGEHAAAVIAPPYDVVSTDEARALVRDRPASFLHVSRPEIDLAPGTSPYSDAAYARAADNLKSLRASVLTQEAGPAFYVYRMRAGDRVQTGVACVAAIAAYEANRVKKHELTRPDKEDDRVRNIEALSAQTGPVLCAYRSDAKLRTLLQAAASTRPTLEAVGPNEVLHSVWCVEAAAQVAELSAALNALDSLYIADGHHRAAAAARVARMRGAKAENSQWFLTIAFPHDEMRILDYNRVVRDLNGLARQEFLDRLRQTFSVEAHDGVATPTAPETFGMYLEGRWYRLRIRGDLVPRSDPVASLDVSLLQDHLLSPVLAIGDPRTDPRIDFIGGVRGAKELERRVDSGEAAVAFALHATRMEQLMAVADANKLMPPKSTWFEPKLADGLLSHVLE